MNAEILVPSIADDPRRDLAVVLNVNARGCTGRLVRRIKRSVPSANLFLSRSLLEAQEIVDTVLRRRIRLVLAGGGDGTIVDFANRIRRGIAATGAAPASGPALGILKMGTGNALAYHIGSGSPVGDLRWVRDGQPCRRTSLNLISANGRDVPFVGIGWDGAILNDYISLRERYQDGPLRPLLTGLSGYLLASLLVTAPREWRLRHDPTWVSVINTGGPAHQVGAGGRIVRSFAPGETLYEGPMQIAAASTTPYYGYGFRLFPYATSLTDRFHLRLYSGGVPHALVNLRSVWNGTFASPALTDFLVDRVHVVASRPMPFQMAGDAAGSQQQMELSLAPDPLQLFAPERPRRRLLLPGMTIKVGKQAA
ncbi:MAG: hypothetical protein HYV63_04730 [Candidatus Schekmanbacteria bacterium]|nr:hypothetical protein [Candidatus Schekmanbacteria bacterium]